jgi:plastocyanin
MKISRRAFTAMTLVIAGGVGSVAVAATKSSKASSSKTPAKVWPVKIDARTAHFLPGTLAIKAGDSVEWTNPSFVVHTVDFDPHFSNVAGNVALPSGVAPFSSGLLEQDATFKHTFDAKGTYKYVCRFHEAMGMVGSIVVS